MGGVGVAVLQTLTERLDQVGALLDALLHRRGAICGLLVVFGIVLSGAALSIGIASFSPDSWSLFELARTVFSGHFYTFNTIRSYLPGDHAASFPFGYPVLLALLQSVLGARPGIAIGLNIASTLAICWLAFRVADSVRLPRLAALVLVASLLSYPGYLAELFAGRTIPLAILTLAGAGYAHVSGRAFACGLLLGASALVRFDCLVFSLAFITANGMLNWRAPGRTKYLLGFLIGCLPWIFYSQIYFGRFWVSDNGWIASSALAANVLDFPAIPTVRAQDNPQLWLSRLAFNVRPLLSLVYHASVNFSAIWLLSATVAWRIRQFPPAKLRRLLVFALGCAGCLTPYLLTGYLDSRYFTPLFLVATAVLLAAVLDHASPRSFSMLLIVLLVTLALGVPAFLAQVGAGHDARARVQAEEARIPALRACQLTLPGHVFLFTDHTLATRYGAVTGLRTALTAGNFKRMDEPAKARYLARMAPYVLVDGHSERSVCPHLP